LIDFCRRHCKTGVFDRQCSLSAISLSSSMISVLLLLLDMKLVFCLPPPWFLLYIP